MKLAKWFPAGNDVYFLCPPLMSVHIDLGSSRMLHCGDVEHCAEYKLEHDIWEDVIPSKTALLHQSKHIRFTMFPILYTFVTFIATCLCACYTTGNAGLTVRSYTGIYTGQLNQNFSNVREFLNAPYGPNQWLEPMAAAKESTSVE